MGALPGNAALIQHIDAVAVHHIGQTVGDEDDRFLSGKAADGLHDVVFALGVYVGSGFVKEIDGCVVQQSARHGKALALAAGQVAAAFMQGSLQAVLAAAEAGQIHLFQRCPQFAFGRVRLCHAQVAFHRAFENGGIVGHQGQGAHPLFPLQFFHRHTAQRHPAGIAGAAAGQQSGNGALAAATLAHQ